MCVFTSVDVSWPGSVHDSRIWKNSDVREVMRRTQNTVLIADQGCGIEPWLMTPYREPVNIDVKKAYNKLLSKERVVLEQCFGQIKRRFPILKYCCRVKLTNVPDIIVACIILHNIAKPLQDPDFEGSDEDEDGAGDVVSGHEEENDDLRVRGQEVREVLANIIQNYNAP
ncbi:unnamed protein product [Acanthoscelides obtectus]|uniref:DDE Tnp4 domain-containing protein n=1 Tax=Acanthoscelides obtectus TaxID=200917 RepID=A0A9P0Q4I5_ACAOB|nr:unnamed protein product [Acanthoscelides obtectus]CAK1680402.1 Putative nuclease HARBI1 [Acanthoscelides obtectus]